MSLSVDLRPAEASDKARILGWRNSPDVRPYMYTDHLISPDEHERSDGSLANRRSRRIGETP